MRSLRRSFALCALLISATAVAACGGLPGNAVVSVGGDAITKADFDHFLPIAYQNIAQQQQGAPSEVPDAPEYKKCIAAMKKAAVKPPKGQPRPTDETYKQQCEAFYKNTRDSVMQYFIQSAWFIGEAHDRDMSPTDKEVKEEFDKQRKASFPTQESWDQFLKSSDSTIKDLLLQVKASMIQQRLQTELTKGTDKVTPAQISAYYDKNKKQFAQPENRAVKMVMTKDKATADKARAAIAGGRSWASVAKQYSIDETSKSNGGELPSVAEGQQDPTLDKALFSASKGKLSGPVKTQFGYYIFEVTQITKGRQPSLKASEDVIKQAIVSENQQKKIEGFTKEFEDKWKPRTECAKDFTIASCNNAPPEKTTTNGDDAEEDPAS